MIRALPLLLVLGCGGLLPPPPSSASAESPPSAYDSLCLDANQQYRTWHTVGIVFTSVGTAATGGGIASAFTTDEKWVGIGLDLFGIASQGLGLAGHLLADDAAEDVVRYCGGES